VLTLIEKGVRDICLCLLPGTHELDRGLSVEAPERTHLTVHGAGRASRLWLGNQGIKFVDFASVTLGDFDIHGIKGDLSLDIRGCNEVTLANLHVAGTTREGASLVSISDALRVEINRSELRGYLRKSLNMAAEVLASVPVLEPLRTSLLTEKGELYQSLDGELVAKLGNLSAARRKAGVTQINRLLRATDDPLLQDATLRQSLVKVRNQFAQPGDIRKLALALEAVRSAIVMVLPGFSLALDGFDAVTAVTGSMILGRMSIYGESAAASSLTSELLKVLGGGLREGKFSLAPGGGDLRLLANHLMDLRFGDAFVDRLKKIADEGKGAVDCYRSLVANDNEWQRPNNEALAIDLGLSLNVLHLKGDFGACIAQQAKYLGNFAHDDFRLFNVGNAAESFGNGGLNIVEL